MQLGEEVVHLKKKTQELKKKEEELEKTVKTYRDQIAVLDTKLAAKTHPEEKSKEKLADAFLKQDYEKLKEKFRHLENAKKMSDKSSRQEVETLTLKLKSAER